VEEINGKWTLLEVANDVSDEDGNLCSSCSRSTYFNTHSDFPRAHIYILEVEECVYLQSLLRGTVPGRLLLKGRENNNVHSNHYKLVILYMTYNEIMHRTRGGRRPTSSLKGTRRRRPAPSSKLSQIC